MNSTRTTGPFFWRHTGYMSRPLGVTDHNMKVFTINVARLHNLIATPRGSVKAAAGGGATVVVTNCYSWRYSPAPIRTS